MSNVLLLEQNIYIQFKIINSTTLKHVLVFNFIAMVFVAVRLWTLWMITIYQMWGVPDLQGRMLFLRECVICLQVLALPMAWLVCKQCQNICTWLCVLT